MFDCYLKFVLVIEVIGGERSKLLRHEEAVVDVLGRHEVLCSFHARVQVLNLINNKHTQCQTTCSTSIAIFSNRNSISVVYLMWRSSRDENGVAEELDERVRLNLVLVEETLAERGVQVERLVVNGVSVKVDLLTSLLCNFVEHISDLVGVLRVEDVPQCARTLSILVDARHCEGTAARISKQIDSR